MTTEADRRSPLERALSVVTDIKAGEGVTALLLTANVFLLLTAYYVIKPVREGLILAIEGGARYKSYLGAAIAIALLVAVPAYARVSSRVAKNKLVVGVTLFFVSHLVLFYVLATAVGAGTSPSGSLGVKALGLGFFVWVGVFNMMVVAQFWAFANDLYTEEQGKRLFALVGIGASVGAVAGAWLTKLLVKSMGTNQLLLLAGAVLVGCAALTHVTHLRERARLAGRDANHPAPAPMSRNAKAKPEPTKQGAFGLVFSHRYLTLLAAFSLVFTFVNTNGEFILSSLVKDAAAEAQRAAGEGFDKRAYIAAFYGDFFLWVNILGVVLQTFAVSRIVKLGGIRLAFMILPVIALLDSSAVVVLPILSVLRLGKIAENATDYSINNTVRNMLWLPTTTEMKYNAKQAVDTFFVRMGDVASAGLVFVLAQQWGLGVRAFSATNLALVAVWIWLARGILKKNAELAADQAAAEKTADA